MIGIGLYQTRTIYYFKLLLNITSWSWKFKGAGKSDSFNPGSRALNQNLKGQIAALYGGGHKVDSILKHNMMINSYRSGKYTAAKAQLHSEGMRLIPIFW